MIHKKPDWSNFMPKGNMTLKEIVKLLKLMNIKFNFNIINVPKKMQRHFMKMENETL